MPEPARYIVNNLRPLRRSDSRGELLASLRRIIHKCPPTSTPHYGWSQNGLYAGPTSVAYLFLVLSQVYEDHELEGNSLRTWCLLYLRVSASGLKESEAKVDPAHCGVANELLVQTALHAVVNRDSDLARKLCSYAPLLTSNSEQGSDEWLYGRAGYLYLLRMLRSCFQDDSAVHALIEDAIGKVVHRISSSPRPWMWHGQAYLGAAHGAIGIILQVVLSSPSSAPSFQSLMSQLLDLQFQQSGNFPSSVPVGGDRLVQFCHGAPGFVLSLVSLRPHFPDLQARIDTAIERGRGATWERGLLTKTSCLCHGVAGNALALGGEDEFDHFLSFMASDDLEKQSALEDPAEDDQFAGLFDGEAGRAWAWAVADAKLSRVCIGYNDL